MGQRYTTLTVKVKVQRTKTEPVHTLYFKFFNSTPSYAFKQSAKNVKQWCANPWSLHTSMASVGEAYD
jgi:hypothetical protein